MFVGCRMLCLSCVCLTVNESRLSHVIWRRCFIKAKDIATTRAFMRRPAPKDITSKSVEVCETEVCSLYFQLMELMGTNVRLPKIHRIPPDVDLEFSRSPAKSESWNRPNRQC